MGKAPNSVINDRINKMLKRAFNLFKKREYINEDIYLQYKKSVQVTLPYHKNRAADRLLSVRQRPYAST